MGIEMRGEAWLWIVVLGLVLSTAGCRKLVMAEDPDGGGGDSDSDTDTDTDTETVDCEEVPDYCCALGCPCESIDEDCVFPDWGPDNGLGVCKPEPEGGECWSDDDCGAGAHCAGEMVCPCDMDCGYEQTGICVGISAGCCDNDEGGDCPDDQFCLEMHPQTDTCHPNIGYPWCWTDAECQNGECINEILCSCDEECESDPGLCADEN
jgi:hypothetical protein